MFCISAICDWIDSVCRSSLSVDFLAYMTYFIGRCREGARAGRKDLRWQGRGAAGTESSPRAASHLCIFGHIRNAYGQNKRAPFVAHRSFRNCTKVALSPERQKVAPLFRNIDLCALLSYHFFAYFCNFSTLPRSTLGVSFPVPSFVAMRAGWLPNIGFPGSLARASGCQAQPFPTRREATHRPVMYSPMRARSDSSESSPY